MKCFLTCLKWAKVYTLYVLCMYSVYTLYCIVEYIYYITTYNMIYKVRSLKSSNFKNSFLDENITKRLFTTLLGSLFGFCGVGGGGGGKKKKSHNFTT